MPKRKADDLENSEEHTQASHAPKAEPPVKYVYAVLEEGSGVFKRWGPRLKGCFMSVEEANKEARVIAHNWDRWTEIAGNYDHQDHGLLDLEEETGMGPEMGDYCGLPGTQEWKTPRDEIGIILEAGEGNDQKISVVRQRVRSTSNYEARKRRKAKKEKKKEKRRLAAYVRENDGHTLSEDDMPMTREEFDEALEVGKEKGFFWYEPPYGSGHGRWLPVGFDITKLFAEHF